MAEQNEPIMSWSFIRKCEPSDTILDILVPGEHVLQCYATLRDKAALTDKRIIFADVPRNATGKIEKPALRKKYGAEHLVAQQNRG